MFPRSRRGESSRRGEGIDGTVTRRSTGSKPIETDGVPLVDTEDLKAMIRLLRVIQIVSELPSGTNWNFDEHWYPKIPGVISASSFDGKIGIYNIEVCARYGVGESCLVPAPLKAPKWYQRKAGITFGFGGKLVSFHSTGSSPACSEVFLAGFLFQVNVQDLVTGLNLVSTSSDFEAAMKSGDRSSLRLLCDQKYQESESEDDEENWGFLKVMFEDDDGTARTKLLNHLGFIAMRSMGEQEQEVNPDEMMNGWNNNNNNQRDEKEACEDFLNDERENGNTGVLSD